MRALAVTVLVACNSPSPAPVDPPPCVSVNTSGAIRGLIIGVRWLDHDVMAELRGDPKVGLQPAVLAGYTGIELVRAGHRLAAYVGVRATDVATWPGGLLVAGDDLGVGTIDARGCLRVAALHGEEHITSTAIDAAHSRFFVAGRRLAVIDAATLMPIAEVNTAHVGRIAYDAMTNQLAVVLAPAATTSTLVIELRDGDTLALRRTVEVPDGVWSAGPWIRPGHGTMAVPFEKPCRRHVRDRQVLNPGPCVEGGESGVDMVSLRDSSRPTHVTFPLDDFRRTTRQESLFGYVRYVPEHRHDAAWSADGSVLFVPSWDAFVRWFPDVDRIAVTAYEHTGMLVWTEALAPDGQHVAVVPEANNVELRTLPAL